jgi:hypothetical protein
MLVRVASRQSGSRQDQEASKCSESDCWQDLIAAALEPSSELVPAFERVRRGAGEMGSSAFFRRKAGTHLSSAEILGIWMRQRRASYRRPIWRSHGPRLSPGNRQKRESARACRQLLALQENGLAELEADGPEGRSEGSLPLEGEGGVGVTLRPLQRPGNITPSQPSPIEGEGLTGRLGRLSRQLMTRPKPSRRIFRSLRTAGAGPLPWPSPWPKSLRQWGRKARSVGCGSVEAAPDGSIRSEPRWPWGKPMPTAAAAFSESAAGRRRG